MKPRVAVVGGGWAGCAAALTLAEAGLPVTLYEAARALGGRARAISIDGRKLDNGQHILLGAYTQTLRLIAGLRGAGAGAGLMRLPLLIEQPPAFRLACPRLPAPLNLLGGLISARGLNWQEKWRAARWARSTLRRAPQLSGTTVDTLLADQPEALRRLLWHPLCLSALNTPPEAACAETFRAVLAAAFGARREHSDLLLPRQDLGALFPEPAAARIEALGGALRLDARVHGLALKGGKLTLTTRQDEAEFDRLVLAVAPQHLAGLAGQLPGMESTLAGVAGFRYEPIATAYLQYPAAMRLSRPMLALAGAPGQFVFDRGQTHGQAGLLAVVVSAARGLLGQPHDTWLTAVEAQLAGSFALPRARWRRGVIEKQATYACVPDLPRPGVRTADPRVFLAGDYTAGPYPATLESATLSGVQSALALLDSL
jgi:squalene-associated FAD-dependent desaturase